MNRNMKKLSVLAILLLIMLFVVFGAAQAEAGKTLRTKIPIPKTKVWIQKDTPGLRKLYSNYLGEKNVQTCEPFTYSLGDSVLSRATKFEYVVGINDGTHPQENGQDIADTLYSGPLTNETSFSYTFYQPGDYVLFVYLYDDNGDYIDEDHDGWGDYDFYNVTVSEGTGENLLMNTVKAAAEECRGDDDFEKALAINDWLCRNVTYDDSLQYYNAEGALLKRTSVCNGYCRAFELIAKECGLDVNRAVGTALNEKTGIWGGHAWNVVKMDGDWYQLDVTWNDNNHHIYFGLTDNLIKLDHKLENYPNGASYTCDSLKDNYFVRTGKWRTVLAKDSIESIQSQINKGEKTVEASLGKLYAEDGNGCWSESESAFAGIYGNVLAYAYTVNTWQRVNGDSAVDVKGVFTYDNQTRNLTGTIGGLALTPLVKETYDTGEEITYSANYDADDPTGITLSSRVYKKDNNTEYYSKQFDTYQGQDSVTLWYNGTYVLEVSAMKGTEVVETQNIEFTVSASMEQLDDPIFPEYLLLPEDNQPYELLLTYNEDAVPDTVDIRVKNYLTGETVAHGEGLLPNAPLTFPVRAGDYFYITFTAYKKGYSSADGFVYRHTVKGVIDSPKVTVAESLLAGEPLAITVDAVPNAQGYGASLWKQNEGNGWFNHYRSQNYDQAGTYDLSLLGLDEGTYQIRVYAHATNYVMSKETTKTFVVTGERPDAPTVTVPEGSFSYGETAWFTVSAEGLTAAAQSHDRYYYEKDGIYQAQNGTVLVGAAAYPSDEYSFCGMINGRWSKPSDPVTLENVGESDPEPEEGTPEFEMSSSISQGSSLRISVKPVTGAEVYAVSVGRYDAELSDEYEYPYYEQILYDMPFDISEGGVTIDGCYLLEPGTYQITVTAYKNAAGYYLCGNEKTLTVTADSNLPVAPTATLISEGKQKIYGTTSFRVQTGGGADKIYAFIHRKDDSGLDVNPIIIDMNSEETECTYEWVNRNSGEFEACFAVSRDGVWSETSNTVKFTVENGDDWEEESELTYPAEAIIGENVTVEWNPPKKAEWYEAEAVSSGKLLYEGVIQKGNSSFTIDTSKAESGGRVEIEVRAYAPGYYPIYMNSKTDMELLDPKLKITAKVTGTDTSAGTVTLSLSNVASNRVRVRVDGKDAGIFGIGKNSGIATITVPVTSMDSQIRVANYDTDGTKWGTWSDPVTGSGTRPESWDLVLPAFMKEIKDEAFAGIAAKTVRIPDGCTSIGKEAFAGSALKAIEIPESVISIGDDAFPEGTVIFALKDSNAAKWAEARGYEVYN